MWRIDLDQAQVDTRELIEQVDAGIAQATRMRGPVRKLAVEAIAYLAKAEELFREACETDDELEARKEHEPDDADYEGDPDYYEKIDN